MKEAFEVQLCGIWIIKEGEDIEFDRKMWIQPKIDGIRNIMILSDNPISLSRNAKPNYNTEEMIEALSKYAKDFVIDGELFAGSFDKTITAVKTHNYKADELIFYTFDIIPLSEFKDKTCTLKLRGRDKVLKDVINKCNYPKIKYIGHEEVRSNDDIIKITKRYIEQGFEGSIIKDPDSLYGYSRGNSWYKFKQAETFDYRIIDTLEGTGKYKGMLGSLVMDVNGIRVNVGTGFTDSDRKKIWYTRNNLAGKYVEVKFQKKTKSGSLRHPSFITIREDK